MSGSPAEICQPAQEAEFDVAIPLQRDGRAEIIPELAEPAAQSSESAIAEVPRPATVPAPELSISEQSLPEQVSPSAATVTSPYLSEKAILKQQRLQEERALIAQAQAGDQEAFVKLMDMYKHAIFSQARRAGLGVQDVEDVLQEVALQAYENIGTLSDTSRGLGPWVRKITRNLIVNIRRQRLGIPVDPTEWQDPNNALANLTDGQTAESLVLTGITPYSSLAKVLRQLDNVTRIPDPADMVAQLCMEGMKGVDYSAITGIPEGTVRTRLNRLRQHLRKILAEEMRAEGEYL